MSRIGKLPIEIPQGVAVEIKDQLLVVKGPKGELSQEIRPEIKMTQVENMLNFEISTDSKESNALWGLSRALANNMVVGVTDGYEKKLEIVGVGYRGAVSGNKLTLSIGYSHPVEFEAPEGITIGMEDNKNITISGFDKQVVGQVAAKIRSFRRPEPYKGKGIKYVDEVIKRKAGKSAKA